MILAIDVGNTNIVFGGVSDGKTAFISRISTDKDKTSDEYAVQIKILIDIWFFQLKSVTLQLIWN